MIMGVRRRGGPRRHVQLAEDVAQVPLHRLLAQHENTRDLVIALTFGHQAKDLDFSLGKAARPRPSQ